VHGEFLPHGECLLGQLGGTKATLPGPGWLGRGGHRRALAPPEEERSSIRWSSGSPLKTRVTLPGIKKFLLRRPGVFSFPPPPPISWHLMAARHGRAGTRDPIAAVVARWCRATTISKPGGIG
jgi:hypothetical protein